MCFPSGRQIEHKRNDSANSSIDTPPNKLELDIKTHICIFAGSTLNHDGTFQFTNKLEFELPSVGIGKFDSLLEFDQLDKEDTDNYR